MIDPHHLQELVDRGWRCLNCGAHVPESCKLISETKIVFEGMCQSDTCEKLPPGGNPFFVVIE